jgi:tRNA(Ile)-lysidine synthase
MRRHSPPFSPDVLAQRLAALDVTRFRIAYSGGCDSHALLHALAQVRTRLPPLQAVHVDHGLQPDSAAWARHCAAVCAGLQIPFLLLKVAAGAAAGESPEAAARRARYRALAELTERGDCLLTAHHQDDQAETLLLQLLRGGGPHGLAAMPEFTAFAAGWHCRPLLPYGREALRRYAGEHALRWIDDPSNADRGFDRNYLRHTVMPVLRKRWPAAAQVLARGAAHQAEAAQVLDELAALDLARCRGDRNTLHIPTLIALGEARQRNLLRHWLKTAGYPLPDTVRLAQVQGEVLHAAPDRAPTVEWPGVTVRRYRDRLYALPPRPAVDGALCLTWDMRSPLQLPDGTRLSALPVHGAGVKAVMCRENVISVRYRQGGETCRPGPRAANRPLKQLLQEAGVPPWERQVLPLIYVGERLAAVADYWVCAPCGAEGDEPGLRIAWCS